MVLFLTSNIGGVKKENGNKIPVKFFEENNFLNNLKKYLKNNRKFVLIASDPTKYEQNDLFLNIDKDALLLSGIEFKEYIVLDNRNKDNVKELLANADLIFLCGGNTLIQNTFFNDIELNKYLNNTDSTIVGISAGSINAAKNVFNSPECEEDLIHSPYLNGLNLTNINIEPHFKLDGADDGNKKIQRDSIIKESYNRTIYALPDGAYILETKDFTKIFGQCYKIENGNIVKISDDDGIYIVNEIN